MPAIEAPDLVAAIKRAFAPDGGAEREHNATGESLGFGAIHYGLVANLRPRRVLVIGSRYGYVPAIIALAVKDHAGTVDFVDANYSDAVHGFRTAYGGVGHWRGEGTSSFAALGVEDVVRVHVMRSDAFFAACKSRYEYVYLDGDHSYEGCRLDFMEAVRRAEPGALIALHDVSVTDPAFGAGRVFAELDPRHFGKLLIPAWPGLGIVQLRTDAEDAVIAKNPFQIPRLQEIEAGRKFWGYLDTEALQTRYVLAAHYLRHCRDVVEIGGYRQNVITNFLTGQHDSVSVFSLDAEFESLERDTLNGTPCRVRHVQDFFQEHLDGLPAGGLGLVALGLEIHGDLEPFLGLMRRAQVAVLEVPVEHQPSLDCLARIRAGVPCRLRARVCLDLSANAEILQDELARTNMNRPFWKRDVYVIEPAN